MELTVVIPAGSDDELSDGLVWLTEQLCDLLDEDGSGGLGGEFGYGVNYENEVFSMHRFCWCSGNDCPWCSYNEDAGHYFQERFAVNGAEDRGDGYKGAPNFWHKPSGLKVWWYKWIGRDNAVKGTHPDIRAMFEECLRSVKAALHA